jgi:hypothetical protein
MKIANKIASPLLGKRKRGRTLVNAEGMGACAFVNDCKAQRPNVKLTTLKDLKGP